MKILIVTPYLPWPLDAGGKAAQYSSLLALAADHTFVIVCPGQSVDSIHHAQELERRLPHVSVRLVLDHSVLPLEATRSARRSVLSLLYSLSTKLLRLIQGFVRRVKLLILSVMKNVDQFGQVLSRDTNEVVPYFPFTPLSADFLENIEQALEDGADVVQVEFADMLSISSWLPKHIPRIFVHHQLHWVYADRLIDSCGGSSYSLYIRDYMKSLELSLLKDFSAVVLFSDVDSALLRTALPQTTVYVSPFPVPSDVSEAPSQVTSFSNTFLFIGGSNHYPNRQSVYWLIEDIWPCILRGAPRSKLKIIGQWPQSFVRHWKRDDIRFAGYATDLPSAIKGCILLVPLMIGSGIRTKILAAMAQYVPVVSTSIGCEGLSLKPYVDILVQDSTTGFADAAIRLATEPDLFQNIALSARRVIDSNYSFECVSRRRNQIYQEVVNSARPRASQ